MALGEVVVGVFIALLVFGSVGSFVIFIVVKSVVPSVLPMGVGSSFDSIALVCLIGGSVSLGLAIILYLVYRRF
jgi:hypothetical protein